MRNPSRSPVFASWAAALGLLLAACSAPGSAGPATPSPSLVATSTPVASGLTATDAGAIVLALDPRFAGIGARDPGVVGQGSWYEVVANATGWLVTVQAGWGDCPAGCISRHTWQYAVALDGAASKISETGDPLPASNAPPGASTAPAPTARPTPTQQPVPGGTPSPTSGGSSVPPVPIPSGGGPWLVGVATAGPVCPVERNPPDPACAPRPVVGATIVVLDPGGREVARVTTGADGTYRVAVPAGRVRVEAAPAAGLMGTPAPIDAVVPAGPRAWLRVDVVYDTGIR